MDRAILAASNALTRGRPLQALSLIGIRRDAHALAIRGIALAQLGELDRGRKALRESHHRFRHARQPLWMAKAQAALAEIDFAQRKLDRALRDLDSDSLRALGDPTSASYADLLRARLLALLGRHDQSAALLRSVRWGPAAVLARAEMLTRQGRFAAAERVATSGHTDNPLLAGEIKQLLATLRAPVFRYVYGKKHRTLSLLDIERLPHPYVDPLRRRFGRLNLAYRQAQLELLVALARGRVTAKGLYGVDTPSFRDRLKMSVSRLRHATGLPICATKLGFIAPPIGLLLPALDPIEALLSDDTAWPPSSIARLLGLTVRSVERILEDSRHFRPTGRGRARRYRLRGHGPGIATQLLLLSTHERSYRSASPKERSL